MSIRCSLGIQEADRCLCLVGIGSDRTDAFKWLEKLVTELGLEPPTRVIIAQGYTLIIILQPIVSLSPIPACIFALENIP